MTFFGDSNREIIASTHGGGSFLASCKYLEEALRGGDPDQIKSAQRMFEAAAAQTSLPGEDFS